MKRLKTLRARFVLATAGLLLVGLSIFAVYIYGSMARSLTAAVDQSLELVAAQVLSGLEFQDGRPVFPESFPQEPENLDLRRRGFTVWVYGPQGDLLASFGGYESAGPASIPSQSAAQFDTLIDPASGELIRRFSNSASGESGRGAVVQAATSLEGVSTTLGNLRTTLLVAVPALVALAGVGGYFLVARALQPIDRITRTARQISAEGLSERIGLASTKDEVGRLAATFDSMLARLEESFRRERQFSADASHELRTPLAAIRTILTTTLERERGAEAYRQALSDLEDEADRLQRLTADLLMLARLDSRATLSQDVVDLSTLLVDVSEAYCQQAEGKGLVLRRQIPGGLTVIGDSDNLVRLFSNLIDNAVKFTTSGGICLSAMGSPGGGVDVRITDTGPGIPPNDLPRVFDRFYRADPARSSPGTGLGLAIAAEIAHAHGAQLRASSTDGEGSTFQVTFPRPTPEDGSADPR